ncbi:MAG: hypothetical protein H7Y32_15970, partial [Chloroflexales bacterium]|nr:hypothetical protein [Chloroflexales bacterium]
MAAATDGVVIDVAGYARVASARAQIAANPRCPFAANQLASEIKALYTNVTGLEHVAIVGNDDVIPFFRSRDAAPLGPESDYVPPVSDDTPSQASLRSNYVLSQDGYGSTINLSLGDESFPLPGAAVGRLVETTSDALKLVNAYLALPGGTLPAPASALVTGYDFLEDAANATRDELAAGLRTAQQPAPTVDTLISPATESFLAPDAWSADDLRAQLQSRRHDLIYLAGHFSANSALASDYRSAFGADELASLNIDLQNALVWSAGCHAGYNIVDGAAVPEVTRALDWPQAFAQRGATLIGGTGYQYGDTDFLAYSEQIYREFARQLRVGEPGEAVSIGKALVESKRAYLAATPQLQGIDDKALREATLFGLPMLRIVMPGERIPRPQAGLDAISPAAAPRAPGSAFGLRTADLPVDTSALTQESVDLK